MKTLPLGKKVAAIALAISLLFGGPSFAQLLDSDDETNSWILNLWNPTPTTPTPTTPTTDTEWNIGGDTSTTVSTPVIESSGSGRGGRLGTADYSKRNRSAIATMERKNAMIAKENESESTLMHAAAPEKEITEVAHNTPSLEEIKDLILIAKENTKNTTAQTVTSKIDHTKVSHNIYNEDSNIVDHVLIANAGRDDLVSAYEAPVTQKTFTPTKTQTVKKTVSRQISVPRTTRRTATNTSILLQTEPLLVHKTHLMSWEGMNEDISQYKRDVVKNILLNIIIISGKILFFLGLLGTILSLVFREKLNIYRHRKAQQLTLFSLLK